MGCGGVGVGVCGCGGVGWGCGDVGGVGVIHQIWRSHGLKNRRFESNLSKITRPVAAIKSL